MATHRKKSETTKSTSRLSPSPPEPAAGPEAEAESGADPKPEHAEAAFYVVGLGASAGGLDALDAFFQAMPDVTGIAFVVLTHQHPGHVSLLPDLIAKHTAMPVEPMCGTQ